jgi:O-antigen/teichoic acid export membrane protein
MRGARFALWRDRSFRFAMGAGATVISGVTGILRNKWLAQHLEASGIGILAQIVSSQTWLGTVGGMSLVLPVTRSVGAATGSGDWAGARRVVWAAMAMLTMSASIVIALGLFFAPLISRALLGSPDYASLIRIGMIGVAGVAFQQLVVGIFAGRSDLKGPLAFSAVGGLGSLAATVILVPRAGLAGAVLAVSILFPLGCLGAILLRRKEHALLLTRPRERALTGAMARGLLTVASSALVAGLVDQGVLLTIRSHYVRTFGTEANGLLQAGLSISQQVGAIFYAYLASYAFGKISGIAGVDGTRAYTRKHWSTIMLLAAAALLLTSVAAGPLLRILYSHRFDPAQPLMAWALVGEFGRVGLLTWGLGALPLGGPRLWLPLALVFPTALAIAYTALVASGAGTLSMPRAYAAAGLIAALIVGVVMSRRGVTLGARDVGVFLLGAAALLILAAR